MKAVVLHNHIVINIPRKGKQTEPTREQMLSLVDKQIARSFHQMETWQQIKLKLDTQE